MGRFVRYFCLSRYVSNHRQGGLHSVEVAHTFPAHGLVDMEQNAISVLEIRVLDDHFPQVLPSALKIRNNRFLVTSRFGVKTHFGSVTKS